MATNIFLITSIIAVAITGGYYAYTQNIGNLQQTIVNRNRKSKAKLANEQMKIDPSAIRRKVVNNQYQNKHWQKLGNIVIPNLQISLPIYNQPYNQDALKIGAQQLKSVNNQNIEIDNSMGNGNYILVAHNYNDGKSMFSALQQYSNKDEPYFVNHKLGTNNWLNGAVIYLANDQGVYQYTIDNQQTINEDDLSVRKNNSQATLNIITCLFPSDTYRIDTQAHLTKKWSWNSAPNDVLKCLNQPYNLKR